MFFEKTDIPPSPWTRDATREVDSATLAELTEELTDTPHRTIRVTVNTAVAPWIREIMSALSNQDTADRYFIALQTDY